MTDKLQDLIIPRNERKTLQAIARNECRWPYGDPGRANFYFCGKRAAAGSSYCEFHLRRGYMASSRPYRPHIRWR
jgi:GcrA cell cycle regulator